MKRYYAAAGALLLGTSALAWAADTDKMSVETTTVTKTELSSDKPMVAADTVWDKSLLTAKTDVGTTSDSKLEFASLDKDLEALAAAETGAKLQTASKEVWTDSKVQTASLETKTVETVSTDVDSKVMTASVDKPAEMGMGGPLEEPASPTVAEASNADPELDARGIPVISDPAFVPPGYNGTGGAVGGPLEAGDEESYPACTSARTDNCIQLYERGVRADSTTAMKDDGDVDLGKTETVETEAKTAETMVSSHTEHQGVGGPVEAQSGYPPCSPGPGDDRCIQLYEPGVTGAGN